MTRTVFGITPGGTEVEKLTIGDGSLTAGILTLGAILQDVRLAGVPYGLTLGSPGLAAYLGPMAYFGAVVGPVANRIAGASAVLDGQRHHFNANEGATCLHSGWSGTQALIWEPTDLTATSATLRLSLPDGLGGFPGRRIIFATYSIERDSTLQLSLTATTDRPTWINLANHSYWNLDGTEGTDGHSLRIDAESYLDVDGAKIPTTAVSVAGTRFDFRSPRPVVTDARGGYDHNFCLSDSVRDLRDVAVLRGGSGLQMTLATTETGLQVYDGEGLDTAPYAGHQGFAYGPLSGIALEPQGWPDAPNRPDFPDIRLDPGDTYKQVTGWRFRRGDG